MSLDVYNKDKKNENQGQGPLANGVEKKNDTSKYDEGGISTKEYKGRRKAIRKAGQAFETG